MRTWDVCTWDVYTQVVYTRDMYTWDVLTWVVYTRDMYTQGVYSQDVCTRVVCTRDARTPGGRSSWAWRMCSRCSAGLRNPRLPQNLRETGMSQRCESLDSKSSEQMYSDNFDFRFFFF